MSPPTRMSAPEIVDVIRCRMCRRPVRRTVAMVKRNTRMHAGRCANQYRAWQRSPEALDAHMAMMRTAAVAGRQRRVRERLQSLAPDVPVDVAYRLWQIGYKAGQSHRRRRCASL